MRLDSETFALINEADKLLYQIEGAINLLPETHSILSALTLREALNSHRIDGFQLSISDMFKLFIDSNDNDLQKIKNYINSLTLGQKLLRNVSSSSHIIKSIHKELFVNQIKESNSCGVFRETQTLAGQDLTGLSNVKYIPPQPQEIPSLMQGLEHYIASNISYPVIVNAALIHAQFEMIHPFVNGNGLVGRILLQTHLFWKKRLIAPVLQISEQFFIKRAEYFDRLEDLEKNKNWESWIKFFLHTVLDAAIHTNEIIKKISSIEQNDYQKILDKEFASSSSLRLFDLIFNRPIISLAYVTKELNLNKQTANVVISKFLEEKILEEITGQQRNRLFAYKDYLDILKS